MSNYISKHKPLIAFETQKSEIKNGTSKVLNYLKKKNYRNFYSIENYKSNNFIFKIKNILNFIFFKRKK